MSAQPAIPLLDHVLRPQPPWHVQETTECGQLARAMVSVLTREELQAKLQQEGMAKVQGTLCMTCFNAARRRSEEPQGR